MFLYLEEMRHTVGLADSSVVIVYKSPEVTDARIVTERFCGAKDSRG